MEAEGIDIADVFLFEVLKGCVDPATQTFLKVLRQKSPDLNFEKAWQHLERTNAYELVGSRRKEWKRVALKGGELTLATWRSYQSSFEITMARAEEISEREAEGQTFERPFIRMARAADQGVRSKGPKQFLGSRHKAISIPNGRLPGNPGSG